MKLTKQKLEQLILQEMRYFRPLEFDPREKKKFPQHSDTLADLYKVDREEARSLSQGLRYDDKLPDDEQVVEPIDIQLADTDEKPEDALEYGYHQFKQESLIKVLGMTLGLVKIFFNVDKNKWVVGVYRGSSPKSFSYDGKRSKTFSNVEEAIQYYNQFTDNKYVMKNKQFKRNTDYTPHPDNPYIKKDTDFT